MKNPLNQIKSVCFIGIGGIGMSALARYCKHKNYFVWGYDKTKSNLTEQLQKENILIHYIDDVNEVESVLSEHQLNVQNLLIVYTPAVPENHSELQYFRANGFNIIKRAELLGAITENSYTIAVAGTHGKTTTSTLITHLLHVSGIRCSAFLGGISVNYNTNTLLSEQQCNCVVVEADEYDRSFLTLNPDIAVITSIDADHLDIYGNIQNIRDSFSDFVQKIKLKGLLIVNEKVNNALRSNDAVLMRSYGFANGLDCVAYNCRVEKGKFYFDLRIGDDTVKGVEMGVPGKHNIENALAAVLAAKHAGASLDKIVSGLKSFKGVKRRFEYHIDSDAVVYIDDYAHHPEELKACFSAAKELYPDKKITGIFQPHLFSRTKDFSSEFARALDMLDEAYLYEIYPAREKPIPGVNSKMLLDKMRINNKHLVTEKELLAALKRNKPEVLISAGAGDIDNSIDSIKKVLIEC